MTAVLDKAATMTGDGEITYASFPIEKIETTPDGDLLVWGKATDGSVDSDEQIVDPEFAAKGIGAWLADGPNVRVQHQPQRDPAGVGVDMEVDKASEAVWVKSRIIEPVAQRLVKGGALRAYSVGIARPTIIRDNVARGGRITDGQIVEISLVDRPANKNCGIQLVKAAKDGTAEFVGKVFGATALLTKDDATEDVTLTLPADVHVGFSPADLARIVNRQVRQHNDFAAKQGETVATSHYEGGTHLKEACDDEEEVEKGKLTTDARNDLPESDFALPGRGYPIHDESHARNALSRVSANGTPEEKKRVRAAVHARYPNIGKPKKAKKGMSVGPGISPASAQTGASKMSDKKAAKAAAKAAAAIANEAKPDMTKPVEKKDKCACMGCGAMQNTMHKFCSECGKSMDGAMPVEKNHDFMCLGCGKKLDKGEQHCPECGKENPGYNPMADQKIPANSEKTDGSRVAESTETAEKAKKPPMKGKKGKKGKPFGGNQAAPFGKDKDGDDGDAKDKADKTIDNPVTASKAKKGKKFGSTASPAEGVVGEAGRVHSVPAHREPDGLDVEEFERDAGLPSSHDSLKFDADPELATSMRLKSVGITADLGFVHDLVCPVFSWDQVAKAYPTGMQSFDANSWQQKALDAATSAPLAEAQAASKLGQHAYTIKSAAVDDLMDVKNDLYKAFKDANPGPGSFPTPGEISSTQFQRPYVTTGRAALSHQYGSPNDAHVPDHSLAASQFGRGFIDSGRAEDSPANKDGTTGAPYPQKTNAPMNLNYSNIHKENIAAAFNAMHSHFDRVFPGVCPMNGPTTTPPAHSLVPAQAHKSGEEPAVIKKVSPDGMSKGGRKKLEKKLTKRVMKGKMALDEARIRMGKKPKKSPEPLNPTKSATADIVKTDTLTKADVSKAVSAALKTAQKQSDKRITALTKVVNALADQPDPQSQAFKGMALNPIRKSAPPEGVQTVADVAARTQLMVLRELEDQARNHPDPALREAAWSQVLKMKGLTS